jgi:hypothetical protein
MVWFFTHLVYQRKKNPASSAGGGELLLEGTISVHVAAVERSLERLRSAVQGVRGVPFETGRDVTKHH